MQGYRRLIVWQKADELAYSIFIETKHFPKEETYGLTSQLRRAALSIPTNIAEGSGRRNPNEFRQFVNIALGSLAEVEYLLSFCLRLNYLKEERYFEIESLRKFVGSLLCNLYKSF